MSASFSNRLLHETSPYLLQHAHNPVDWYPWGAEALERARREDRPILLSIGYSACHWCHVMAHESFEDPATARLMNQLFVNIKVDREERPDLDKIYQTAHHLLAQRPGGWPLTMFLTPDTHAPFFGGTYFPPQARHGLPAFPDLLRGIAEFYRRHRADITRHTQELSDALRRLEAPATGQARLDDAPLHSAYRQMAESFDRDAGGFGRAPKFPHLGNLEFLLHYAQIDGEPEARRMALFSLRKMALGGIYDQLGGGFCRYATDDMWMVPHFEKMLYDNGPALALYSRAWQIERDPLWARTVRETAAWAMRDMQSPQGGFYSSLDADSEGTEGRFYLWERERVRGLLDADEYPLFARHFGLERPANFEGRWHLHVYHERAELAQAFGLPAESVDARLDAARGKLFALREQRVRPGRDEKILTAWNALMIEGLAVAGRVFAEPAYIEAAQRALDFVRGNLWNGQRLLATCKDGKAHLNAYLDDYAFLIGALLELLQARWRADDLRFAVELAEVLLDAFEDPAHGGFYFTSDDHEKLLQRPKSFGDDSLPAGNGVAALALGRLGHLLGERRYLDAAERTLRAAWPAIAHLPYAHTSLLLALEEYLWPPQTVVLRGDAEALAAWLEACRADYAPHRLCLAVPPDAEDLPGMLAERAPQGRAVAYVCRGHRCALPATSLEALRRELAAAPA